MHLTGAANHSHALAFHKFAVAKSDELLQATVERGKTREQTLMCVRVFMENEHDTQQLTTTRRWATLCGWNATAVSVPTDKHCFDYVYLPTCVYLMLSALITLGGGGGRGGGGRGNRELWKAVEFNQ